MRNWEQYFESIIIPNIKIDEFITGVERTNKGYINILSSFYNTNETYVDVIDTDKHIFKINDLTGDILNNNRVTFTSMVFEDNQIEEIIKNNIVSLSMQEFYSNIPNMLNIYGIDIKPVSFINKDDLNFTISESLTKFEIIRILSHSSGYHYDSEVDGYHIWSKKQ